MNTQGTGTRITGLTEAPLCSLRARRDSADQRPVKRPHSTAETGIAASAIRVPHKITSAEVNNNLGDYTRRCHGHPLHLPSSLFPLSSSLSYTSPKGL